jgi:hypothetical protein
MFYFSPSSWQQSLPALCLGFFYLIVQRARTLIYRADIACRLKHSAIIRRTAVTSRIPSLFHRTVLDRVANILLIEQVFKISHSSEQPY